MTDAPIIRKAPCNRCLRDTNHRVLHVEKTSWDDVLDETYGVSIGGGNTYSLLQCAGCDDVRLEHSHWFSEHCDEHGVPFISVDFFPPTILRHRPRWMTQTLPFSVSAHRLVPMFEEVYQAYAAGSFRLAAMGIRAIVEAIMIDQCGDLGSFAQNTAAFVKRGFLAPAQEPTFRDALLDSGHAAMHRGWEPTAADLSTLIDIVEQLVETVYYQEMRSQQLRADLPARATRQTSGSARKGRN